MSKGIGDGGRNTWRGPVSSVGVANSRDGKDVCAFNFSPNLFPTSGFVNYYSAFNVY